MMARWVVGVVMLAACGRSPVEGNSGDASSSGATGTTTQSSASTGVTATATATATATDTNDTGGSATQGADDSSGASTEPTPTTGGPGSSGDETTVGVSGTSTGGPSTGAAETDTGADTGTDTGVDTSSTGEAETGSSSTSMGPDTDTDMPPQEGLWMVMLEDTSSPTRLYKIDLLDGHSTLLCALDTNNNYNTSTFGRDGTLYAANADTKNLEAIDPCTCKRTVLGPTKVDALPGITTDQALGLYGLETTVDQLMAISTMNGSATPVGPLGINWGTGGLTWSDDLKDAFAINGTDDRLYTINHLTGKATLLVQTDYDFGSVGIEWHPKSHEIFACSNPAELLRVEQKDGAVTVVGPMLLENKQAHCDNLAAPWVPVACVENK
jgi:hypothetical protein